MDMSSPVTRGEFEDRLALLATKDDLKTSLEIWGGALLARIESSEQRSIQSMQACMQALEQRMGESMQVSMQALEQRMCGSMQALEQRMCGSMQTLEQRLLDELGRHTRAVQESMQQQIAVLDDKYGDLPGRGKRRETKAPPPRKR
jgi:hypothetical protein